MAKTYFDVTEAYILAKAPRTAGEAARGQVGPTGEIVCSIRSPKREKDDPRSAQKGAIKLVVSAASLTESAFVESASKFGVSGTLTNGTLNSKVQYAGDRAGALVMAMSRDVGLAEALAALMGDDAPALPNDEPAAPQVETQTEAPTDPVPPVTRRRGRNVVAETVAEANGNGTH